MFLTELWRLRRLPAADCTLDVGSYVERLAAVQCRVRAGSGLRAVCHDLPHFRARNSVTSRLASLLAATADRTRTPTPSSAPVVDDGHLVLALAMPDSSASRQSAELSTERAFCSEFRAAGSPGKCKVRASVETCQDLVKWSVTHQVEAAGQPLLIFTAWQGPQ